jgi:hypothetical protein
MTAWRPRCIGRPVGGRSLAQALVVVVAAAAVGGCAPVPPPSLIATTPPPSLAVVATPTAAPSAAASVAPASPTPAPVSPYAALDGVEAAPDVRDRLPVAVMIDDNVVARPQYGFNAASIVYQAPADGGETRYMMVFQERDAKRIEPVRSGRPYFVNWASEYRAAFAHYGGDRRTLAYIPKLHNKVLYNVDALFYSSRPFHRDKERKAPHNAVTGSAKVRAWAVKRGAPATTSPALARRTFDDDAPLAERPLHGWIRIPYNRGSTSYTYDRDTNAYLRSIAGRPQRDAGDGKRVTARNVIVLFMALSIDPKSEPHHNRPKLDHIGSGKAIVFRDGKVINGTWKKASAAALTRIFDKAGAEVSLVRGRIFIQVVKTGTKVTYSAG